MNTIYHYTKIIEEDIEFNEKKLSEEIDKQLEFLAIK